MQRSEKVERSKLADIVDSVFQEAAIAYEDDSDLIEYENADSLLLAIEQAIHNNAHSMNFAIYYPDAKGHFFKDKKTLNPAKCNGASFRYVASGWGLVHLQLDLRNQPLVTVRVTVNSEKRATSWAATHPENQDPAEWNWKFVETQARRIIRVLRKSA